MSTDASPARESDTEAAGFGAGLDRSNSPKPTPLRLLVRQVRLEADRVLSLTMEDPHGGALPEWAPGAHIEIRLPSGLRRHYSLCGEPQDRHAYRVAVLREDTGRGGSRELHQVALTGRTVEVENPVNRFPLSIAPAYLFIAGGIGITPLLPMCRSAASAGIPWALHYGGRSRGSMAFLTELDEFDRAHIAIHPEDEAGLLDLDSILTSAPPNAAIYCCGPSGLLKAVEQRCAAMTLSRQLHVERFSTDSATPSDRPTGGAFDVELRRSGIVLHVPTDRSVLDVVREAVPDVASSCEEGWCGTCETRVLDGQPEHRDDLLSEDERRSGQRMLICVSRSALPKLVLDL